MGVTDCGPLYPPCECKVGGENTNKKRSAPDGASGGGCVSQYLHANPTRPEAFATYAYKNPKEAAAKARQSGALLLRAALGPKWDGDAIGEHSCGLVEQRLLAAATSGSVAHLSELLRVAPRAGLSQRNAYVQGAQVVLRLLKNRADVMKVRRYPSPPPRLWPCALSRR